MDLLISTSRLFRSHLCLMITQQSEPGKQLQQLLSNQLHQEFQSWVKTKQGWCKCVVRACRPGLFTYPLFAQVKVKVWRSHDVGAKKHLTWSGGWFATGLLIMVICQKKQIKMNLSLPVLYKPDLVLGGSSPRVASWNHLTHLCAVSQSGFLSSPSKLKEMFKSSLLLVLHQTSTSSRLLHCCWKLQLLLPLTAALLVHCLLLPWVDIKTVQHEQNYMCIKLF